MYVILAVISYYGPFKSSPLFLPLGLTSALIANLTWLSISRSDLNPSSLIVKGLYWDAMLTSVYMIVPIVFFDAKLSLNQGIGAILIVMGLILTKL